MSKFPQRVSVHLDRSATRAVHKGALRVFDGGVTRVRSKGRKDGQPGDIAILYGPKDTPFAIGVYDPLSPVRVRILSRQLGVSVDCAFIRGRVRAAADARRSTFEGDETDGYRVIHGPGDGLPGLVVDRYANTVVIKCYAHAWLPWLPTIVGALREDTTLTCGLLRLSRALQSEAEATAPYTEGMLLWGNEDDLASSFRENGVRFEVDPRRGQKTGFFLDQRENRARVEKLSDHKTVLNVFCYTGGFTLYAARGGAKRVVSIDASKQAMAALERNIALNPPKAGMPQTIFQNLCGDAFEQMDGLLRRGETFDVVIIDPPSFAKKNAEIDGAQKAYTRLARLGAELTHDNGTLVFASCSSRISEDLLQEYLLNGVRHAQRRIDIYERAGHPADHPVTRTEEQYLKCLYGIVTRA